MLYSTVFSKLKTRQGPTLVDDAVELAKSISASFAQAVIFALKPQHHGSIESTTVIAHRRILEDKLYA